MSEEANQIHDVNAEPPPKIEEPKPVVVESKPGNLIPISGDTQALAPKDHGQLLRFIDQMIKAKAIPKHLENREQVISAWNFAAQLNLPPQPSLRNIAVIKGTPSLFGDLPLALVQRHKQFFAHEEYCIDANYNRICFENKNLSAPIWAGVVMLQRIGMSKPQSFAFTVDDATRAGINAQKTKNGEDTVWAKYPQDMYIRKARIRAIRALFADALTGAAIAEDENYAPDLIDVTPSPDKAASLNARFSPPPVEEKPCPQPEPAV